MKYRFPLLTLALICLVCAQAACGRRGAPKPPEDRAPAAIQFPAASADDSKVNLSWKPPEKSAGGEDLRPLTTFFVLKREVVDDTSKGSFSEIAAVPAVDQDGEALSQVHYQDPDVSFGSRYEYLIVPEDEDGYQGIPTSLLLVSYLGISSTFEVLPFTEDDY